MINEGEWVGQATLHTMAQIRHTEKRSVWRHEGKKQLWRLKHKWKILLKGFLHKYNLKCGLGSSSSGLDPVVSSCEHYKEPPDIRQGISLLTKQLLTSQEFCIMKVKSVQELIHRISDKWPQAMHNITADITDLPSYQAPSGTLIDQLQVTV
jgi:hypothetical protein